MSENKNTRGDIVYISNGSLEDILEHSLTGELDIPVSVDPYPKNIEHSEYILKSKYDLLLKEKEELEKAYEEYNKLLLDECSELVGMATIHGWKSTRVEQGIKCRDKIAELKYKPTEK